MDLLTVVMHEMGLGLGLADGGPGLMQTALTTGTRRLPTAALLAPAQPTPATRPGALSMAEADLLFALLSDSQANHKTPRFIN
jgi:hypothetical protein